MLRFSIKGKYCIIIIPVIAFIWYLIRLHIQGPFYLSRIDPEYPYLLNGLSFAILDFNRIGHIDHPGTPFQLLTGIFIRLTHLFAGQDSIVKDVLSRPELYLSWSTFYLNCITILVILWIGKLIYDHTENWIGVLLIQGTIFLNTILIDIPARYIPDRMHVLLILILIGLIIKKYHNPDYSYRKFAIHSGILLGLGFVTKFNFLPILIIPVIIIVGWRERLIYLGTLIVTTVICFLPIHKKFNNYKSFILDIIKHDELYGTGQERIINFDSFVQNLMTVFKDNGIYTILICVSILLLILPIIKRSRTPFNSENRILGAVIIATLFSILMISKHYKNYYVLSFVPLGGLIFYINYQILTRIKSFKYERLFTLLLLLFLIFLPAKRVIPDYKKLPLIKKSDSIIESFISKNITKNDYIFIEPTWMWGAFPENALVFGCSYAGRHTMYYNIIESLYPNIITWEGFDRPVMYFRMVEANNEGILKSGKNIYLYSTPGRNAVQLIDYINNASFKQDVQLSLDTVFSNSDRKEYILRFSHDENWGIIQQAECGFEKIFDNRIYTDDEKISLAGIFNIENNNIYNGLNAIRLDSSLRYSPSFQNIDVKSGDYLEFTVNCSSSQRNEFEFPDILITNQEGDELKIMHELKTYNSLFIKNRWKMRRIAFTVSDSVTDSSIIARFRYNGNSDIIIDDLRLTHCGRR